MRAIPSILRALKPGRHSGPGKALDRVLSPFKGFKKEAEIGPIVPADVLAALKRRKHHDSKLGKLLDDAYGVAVSPSLGRASAVLGGGYGLGEVFERGRVVGYAAIVQVTLGVQLGGETFHELIVFHDRNTFE